MCLRMGAEDTGWLTSAWRNGGPGMTSTDDVSNNSADDPSRIPDAAELLIDDRENIWSSARIIVRAMLPQQPRRLDHLDVSTMAYRAFPRRRSCCVRLTHSDIGATLTGHPLGPHISLTPSWGFAST